MSSISILMATSIVLAQATTPPSIPRPALGAQAPPLTLSACEVDSSGPNGRRAGRRMSAEVGQVYLSFKNGSAKAATQVHVIFYVDGLVKGESTLNGTYGPGVEFTTHAFRNSALAPITDPDGLTCKISSVKFDDGSEWKGAESPGVVAKQPDSPVRIDECSVRVSGDAAAKFFILAVLSFENTSSVAIGAVKSNLQFSDAFDTALFHDTYTVSGHFAPGARIDPYINPISGNFTYDPSSPVWAVYNLRPSEVATVQCSVSAVRYIDGTIWRDH